MDLGRSLMRPFTNPPLEVGTVRDIYSKCTVLRHYVSSSRMHVTKMQKERLVQNTHHCEQKTKKRARDSTNNYLASGRGGSVGL